MNAAEGCSSVADAAGNLLFYTDGATVWNQQHLVMANGSGLLGNGATGTAQAALIIKKPSTTNTYYVFTLQAYIGLGPNAAPGPDGLRYSIVDMNLAAGMGSVTVKNTAIYAPSTEMLTGVKHCNGNDVWIISHEWNSNNYRAYLLGASGLASNPVISSQGANFGPGNFSGVACMKTSPNGKLLAAPVTSVGAGSNISGFLELFNFDNATGVISNSMSIGLPAGTSLYSCEFSPDGSKLYGSARIQNQIFQWDLYQANFNAIAASQYIMPATFPLGMQLAANGKIYVSRSQQQALGVIQNPNAAGASCNYSDVGQSIGTATCQFGLPGFLTSDFKAWPPAFSFDHNALSACHTASFYANPFPFAFPVITNVLWSFGDPASGAANTSTLLNPSHTYPGAGTYSVILILYNTCGSDTLSQNVLINTYAPTVSISGASTLCSGQSTSLTASGASLYNWSNNTTGSVTVVSPGLNMTYSVTAALAAGCCTASASHSMAVLPTPSLTVTGKTVVCLGNSSVLTAGGALTYSWSGSAIGTNLLFVTPAIGTNTYAVSGSLANGCSNTASITVMAYDCTGFNEDEAGKALRIYPNPCQSQIFIYSAEQRPVALYSETGLLLLEKLLSPGENKIDLRGIPNGIYFLRSKDGAVYKIIKSE